MSGNIKDLRIRASAETGQADVELQKLSDSVENVANSVALLEEQHRKLFAEWSKQKIGGNEFLKLASELRMVKSELNSAYSILSDNSKIEGFNNAMYRGRITAMNFNRVIQDSPYLFGSFQMGLVAIGNNIDPLVQSFRDLYKETGSVKGAFQSMLASMKGGGGLVAIIGLATAAITAFALASANGKSDVKDMKDEIKELADEIQRMSRFTLQNLISEQQSKVSEIKGKMQAAKNVSQSSKAFMPAGVSVRDESYASFESNLALEQEKLNMYKDEFAKLGDIEDVDRRITELTKEQLKIKGDIAKSEFITKEIEGLKDYKKVLMGTYEVEELREKKVKQVKDHIKGMYEILQDFYAKIKNDEIKDSIENIAKAVELITKLQNTGSNEELIFGTKSAKEMSQKLKEFSEKRKEMIGIQRPEALDKGFDVDSFKDDFKELYEVSTMFTTTFTDEFKTAWKDIFGEANSLFEKFAMNVGNWLVKLASQKIAEWIFMTFLDIYATGGVGFFTKLGTSTVMTRFANNGGNTSMSSPVSTKIVELRMNEQVIGKVVDGVFVETYNDKIQKRYM